MSAPEAKGCGCLEAVTEKLKENDQYVSQTMFGNPDRPLMQLMHQDRWPPETRKGKPRSMLPTFCPFGGTKYPGSVEPGFKTEPAEPAPDARMARIGRAG